MNTRDDISGELRELSPALAAMLPVNVFTVPEGYFDGLAASVLRAVHGAGILKSMSQPGNSGVPEGYFEGLAGSIMDKIRQQQASEPAEILPPVLEQLRSINVFTVPEGYFEALPAAATAAASGNETLSPVLEQLRHTNVFEVPQGYFEAFAASVTAAAAGNETLPPVLEQLRHTNVFEVPQGYFEAFAAPVTAAAAGNETLPPVLEQLRHTNVFEVPQGYFENLPAAISARLQPAGKVVSFGRRLKTLRFAAAAVFAGAMLLGVYQWIQPASTGLSDVHKEGIAISKDPARYTAELNNVSDEAIVKFLETGGQEVDAALAALTVDEKELPTEDELMLDDKAVDDFLNNIENKDLNN